MDLKTGLYYFNQRYYDPELGRFLQEDPAAQGANLYQYCGNNPLMYTDPDGCFEISIGQLFGAGVGLVGKDLSKQETWNQIGRDVVTIAAAYAIYATGSFLWQDAVNGGFEWSVGVSYEGIGVSLLGGSVAAAASTVKGNSQTTPINLDSYYNRDPFKEFLSQKSIENVSKPTPVEEPVVSPSVVFRPGVTVKPLMMQKLNELSIKLNGVTVIVNSGIRDQEKQDALKDSNKNFIVATHSQHTYGFAADILLDGISNAKAALLIYETKLFNRVNLYVKTPQGIHVDLMPGVKNQYFKDWERKK